MSGIPAKSVDYSYADHREIPVDVFKRRNINWLLLSNNKLRNISEKISQLSDLTRLALSDNRIEELTPAIGSLKSLTWLDLTRNRLRSLPKEIAKLRNLTGLGLSENEFEEIPAGIYRLFCLKKFGCFANRLTIISPQIKNLINLIKMDLSNNDISELPDEICELKCLSWLNLSNNRLKKLPSKLHKLINLEELGLGSNMIEEMPSLHGLSKLRILPIFRNKVKSIEGLVTLENLEKLDLSDNIFEYFPNEIFSLKKLKYLNLKSNCIETINVDNVKFRKTVDINLLDISYNKLTFIPIKFFRLLGSNASVRLNNNPFEICKHKKPEIVPDLLQLSYNMILNYNGCFKNMWIKKLFRAQHNNCDLCGNYFVSQPYVGFKQTLLRENITFVLCKTMCSLGCYKREFK